MKARIDILSDALAQIEQADDWWRTNRRASPDLIGDELDAAFALREEQPQIGQAFPRPGFQGMRRLLLRRTRCWLYYEPHLGGTT